MKKKVKQGIILTFLLLVAILIIPLSSVYSASEKLYLETSKETAIYGDEVTVTLNFKKEEGNLYAYTAKLSYDKDVFEEISKEDFQESESWKDVTYNSENNKFGLINKEGISSQNIIEVKLRVKENAKRGKTKISVTNAIASNGESDTSLGSAEKEVTIKENELDDVSGIENNTTPTEETKQEQTKKVESKINWPVIIVALIAVAIIIFLIYMFSKYSKIEKEFQVIGIYDSKKYNNTSTPYVPKSIIREINNEIGYTPPDAALYQINIVVDDIDNVDYVENQLYEQDLMQKSEIEKQIKKDNNASEYEYNIRSATHIEISTQRLLKKIELFLLISSIIVFTVLLIITNINKEFLEKSEIGIMKLEGYTNKDIQKIKIIESFLVSLISIIISLLIFKGLLLIANTASNYIIQKETIDLSIKPIQEQLWYIMQIPQKVKWSLFALISVIITFIELINTYIIDKRILSKDIIELLKE